MIWNTLRIMIPLPPVSASWGELVRPGLSLHPGYVANSSLTGYFHRAGVLREAAALCFGIIWFGLLVGARHAQAESPFRPTVSTWAWWGSRRFLMRHVSCTPLPICCDLAPSRWGMLNLDTAFRRGRVWWIPISTTTRFASALRQKRKNSACARKCGRRSSAVISSPS